MMDPCALMNPNGVFGLNHCCNRCWRERVGSLPLARIHWFGLFGLCGPEFQKPFQIGDVVLNS